MTNMPPRAAPRSLTDLWAQVRNLQRQVDLLRSRSNRGTPVTQQGEHVGSTDAAGRIEIPHSLRAPVGFVWAAVADSPDLYVVPVAWTTTLIRFRVIHRVTGPAATTAVTLRWCAMTASRR